VIVLFSQHKVMGRTHTQAFISSFSKAR